MRFSLLPLFLLAFGLLSTPFAQAQNTRQLISQKWDLDIEAFQAVFDAEIAKMAESDPQQAEATKRLSVAFIDQMKGISFDFQSNGTLILTMPTGEQKTTWRLSPDGQKVISKDDQGNEEELIITELTKDKLVIGKEGDEMMLQFKPNKTPAKPSFKSKGQR